MVANKYNINQSISLYSIFISKHDNFYISCNIYVYVYYILGIKIIETLAILQQHIVQRIMCKYIATIILP